MSFASAVRVAAATAASIEAPGGAVSFVCGVGYRPVMVATASNTETWTIAIVLTATGVTGFLEAISAAFAFASVIASARANETSPIMTARTTTSARIFMYDLRRG